ncbi:MAG: putative N-acetylmannosamine-6-phosphate 2-epimerase [Chthonomonadaceae bacterium]|nr:putative N-acetylmannosamine-6-phosphate 2-epimerase [Chthonomonadaceae bacterium]
MKLDSFLAVLNRCPLVVSVQASVGSPLADTGALLGLARASVGQGVKVLRLEGTDSISTIKSETGAIVIGLVKRSYPGSGVYISPTFTEVKDLLDTGCEVIAVDATSRQRPGGCMLEDLVSQIHVAGRLVMADCDSLETALHAESLGCDLISTTLSGYVDESASSNYPDLDLVAKIGRSCKTPVLAEGRYATQHQVRSALFSGACGVVIGGAINDSVKQTKHFLAITSEPRTNVAAVDIGGTWIRFAEFLPSGRILDKDSIARHATNKERLEWIAKRCHARGLRRIGVSSGGVIDPISGETLSSKPTIPDNDGFRALNETYGLQVRALNDGLATAWGHACHGQFADKTVLTLCFGTGVGAGVSAHGRLMTDVRGNYPRVNDLLLAASHMTIEQILGGEALSASNLTGEQLNEAIANATKAVYDLFLPEVIVLAGSVGLRPGAVEASDNLLSGLCPVVPSPFGENAGLHGAAALALSPPPGVFSP